MYEAMAMAYIKSDESIYNSCELLHACIHQTKHKQIKQIICKQFYIVAELILLESLPMPLPYTWVYHVTLIHCHRDPVVLACLLHGSSVHLSLSWVPPVQEHYMRMVLCHYDDIMTSLHVDTCG